MKLSIVEKIPAVFQKSKNKKSFSFFSGGQSDQGYDSLSKEEERMCGRESDNTTQMEDKGLRQSCEL